MLDCAENFAFQIFNSVHSLNIFTAWDVTIDLNQIDICGDTILSKL